MLQGLLTALVTPMKQNGAIDFVSFTNLIELQIRAKVNALIILGSTGEAATLNNDEKISLIIHTVQVLNGRIPLVVGVGQNSTSEALLWVKQLNQIKGIDYILTLTPAYLKPTQNGLYQHFTLLAQLSKFPLILYNVPSRTGCDLADDTTLKLADDFANIVGLKDATANIARCAYLVKHKKISFMLYSGDDATSLAFVLSGGDGAISVTSNVVPQKMSQMIAYALQGDKNSAIVINNQILELHKLLFVESNPIPVKWALQQLGIISDSMLRLPLEPLNEKFHAELNRICNEIRFIN